MAARALAAHANVKVRRGAAGALPFADATFDFGYTLGVLHHTPDPALALRDCVRVLKPGAPLLVYLYYALDGRPGWYRALWRLSDHVRRWVSRRPFRTRLWISQAVAALVYWPLSRLARGAEAIGASPSAMPLAFYRDQPFYVMRTDALDRFGTRIEHRFTRAEVDAMLRGAGLVDIRFSDDPPYWVAVAVRSR